MTWKPYANYANTDIPGLEQIPSHWTVKKLKLIADVRGGVAKGKDLAGQETVRVPYLRVANVQDGYLDLTEVEEIDIPTRELERYLLQPGDVLMNEGGDFDKLGRGHVWRGEIAPCIHQNHVFSVRPRSVSPEWLNTVSGSAYAQFFFMGRAKQSTNLASISASNLSELPVVLPPEEEQGRLLNFLDRETAKIDTLIVEQRTLIERLREKRQSVLTTGITKGLDPDAPMRDSGIPWIGDIPAHWSVIPLKKAIDFQEGPGIMAEDFRDEGVPLLRVGNVSASVVMLEGCNYLDPAKVQTRWNYFKLSVGDLLISASASMGTVCEVGLDAEGSIAYTGIIRLREVPEISFKGFLRHFVVSYPYLAQIDTFKAGTAIQHYGPVHLRQMFFICPSVDEQKAIALYIDRELEAIDRLITEAETSIALLQEHRSALITAVVTGQVDVREAMA